MIPKEVTSGLYIRKATRSPHRQIWNSRTDPDDAGVASRKYPGFPRARNVSNYVAPASAGAHVFAVTNIAGTALCEIHPRLKQ